MRLRGKDEVLSDLGFILDKIINFFGFNIFIRIGIIISFILWGGN